MDQPLVALLLAPDPAAWEALLSGRKRLSIRKGHRDYRVGKPLMIGCHILGIAVMTEVVAVRHCTLAEVMGLEITQDGFASREDMVAGLREFYPDLNGRSEVTVLRWGDLKGTAVDAFHSSPR